MNMNEAQQLQVMPAEQFRLATDVAGVCRQIVTKTAVTIQGRSYVKVEGWMSIATAHGCIASAGEVVQTDKGASAIGEIRRMSDGVVLCRAEGFVGADEPIWYGGVTQTDRGPKTHQKRADYAIRAMAQTRAISRACRTAFAHVVVMMDAGLSTTPAEEVPMGGFGDDRGDAADRPTTSGSGPQPTGSTSAAAPKTVEVPRDDKGAYRLPDGVKWQDVEVHFGKNRGTKLGKLEDNTIRWYAEKWEPKPYGQAVDISNQDKMLLAAVNTWLDEIDTRNGRTA